MSAGISLMYKATGGCDKKRRICSSCRYYQAEYTKDGRKILRSYCVKHPSHEEHANWKGTYLACKGFKNPIRKKEKAASSSGYKTEATGQLAFNL